jgi:hypothetical protein
MSITSVTSSTTIWQAYTRQSSGSGSASGCSGPPGSADDSASISQQGFAALLADQQGGAQPQLSDDQAAQIGAKIQEKDPSLFTKLDSDGDGKLSVSELKSGKDAIAGAHAAEIGAGIEQQDPELFKALDTDGDGTLSSSELKAGRDALQGADPGAAGAGGVGQGGGVHHHHHHGGGGGQSQDGTRTDPLSALFAALNGDDGTDASASPTSAQSGSLTNLQFNALQDALQSLWSTGSSSS